MAAVATVGDTTNLRLQLLDQFGSAVNLNAGGAATTTLLVEKPSGKRVSGAMVVEAGTDGYVNRNWVADDLDEEGQYHIKVRITKVSGEVSHYPAYRAITLVVSDDYA